MGGERGGLGSPWKQEPLCPPGPTEHIAGGKTMRSVRRERIYRMTRSSLRLLVDAALEAERLDDQALAEDLHLVNRILAAVVDAEVRNRYRTPLPGGPREALYVAVSRGERI